MWSYCGADEGGEDFGTVPKPRALRRAAKPGDGFRMAEGGPGEEG